MPSQANIIYQQLGADYTDRIIAPTIQDSVKASVAKFNAEELIPKRATAKAVIAKTIADTLGARSRHSCRNSVYNRIFDQQILSRFPIRSQSRDSR